MKRKITELEQRLIEKGYYLSHKTYGGRKSEKTLSYIYVNKNAFVKLDSKRESVLDYGILNYHAMELTRIELLGIEITLDMIRNDFESEPIKVGDKVKIEPYITKSPYETPSDYDESEELGDMTFEQFDELCKEKEQ
jgi:hypothetical protein